jgi:hypothetical protein
MIPISFLFPLIFLAAPILAYLNYLPYRSHNEVKTTPIPTLFLLRQFIVEPQKQSRRVPPFRYFIQLLLIAAALLLISGPHLKGAEKKVAIIIDDSFSTFAKGKGDSVFFDMKREAINLRKGFTDVYDIFTTSTFPEPINSLDGLSPTYTKDNIENTIQRLLNNSQYERLVILTDKNVPADVQKNVSVRSFNSYRTKSNVAISRVRYDSLNRTISLELRSLSNSATTVDIQVFDVTQKRQIFLQQKELPPQGTTPLSIGPLTLNQTQIKEGFFKVKIIPRNADDAIEEDNIAFFSSNYEIPKILVHSNISIQELGLSRISTYSFETRENAAENNKLDQTEIIGDLFHKQLPASEIHRNTLVINPPPGYFGATPNPAGASIAFIKLDHPITKYLELKNNTLPHHSTFTLPQGAFAVLRSTYGPSIWAETHASNEHILTVSGLEVLPFSGRNSPASSVLLLNLMEYTFSTNSLAENRITNILKNQGKYEYIEVITPEGAIKKKVTPELIKKSLGFIRYKMQDKNPRTEPLSFFAEAESNTNQPGQLNFSNLSSSKVNENVEPPPLSEFFYLAVTILMITILIGDAIAFYSRRFDNA